MEINAYNHPLAENISKIIKDKGVKQSFIAEKAGFSNASFNAMLKGRRLIKACDIPKITNALGITPNELYGINDQAS